MIPPRCRWTVFFGCKKRDAEICVNGTLDVFFAKSGCANDCCDLFYSEHWLFLQSIFEQPITCCWSYRWMWIWGCVARIVSSCCEQPPREKLRSRFVITGLHNIMVPDGEDERCVLCGQRESQGWIVRSDDLNVMSESLREFACRSDGLTIKDANDNGNNLDQKCLQRWMWSLRKGRA